MLTLVSDVGREQAIGDTLWRLAVLLMGQLFAAAIPNPQLA